MKHTIEDKIYDTLLQYREYSELIDYAVKNDCTHIEHIEKIIECVNYIYFIYDGSHSIKNRNHFEIVKSLDYIEFVVLNAIIEGCSIEDIVTVVMITQGVNYVAARRIDNEYVEILIRSISKKLVPFAIRVHNEQEDSQFASVDK